MREKGKLVLLAGAVFLAAACGGVDIGSGSSPTTSMQYAGNWVILSGTSYGGCTASSCVTGGTGTTNDYGTLIINPVTTSTFTVTDAWGCHWKFTIDASGTASLDSGQSCTSGGATASYSSWILAAGTGTLAQNASPNETYSTTTGCSGTCSWSQVVDDSLAPCGDTGLACCAGGWTQFPSCTSSTAGARCCLSGHTPTISGGTCSCN